MKFFIDTANVDDIRKANDMGVICGVTTNPSLIAKEGRDFNEVIKEITSIVDGPISGEVKATTVDADQMELLAPVGAVELMQYKKIKTYDYTSGKKDEKIYALIASNKGEVCKVLFEPNETIVEGFFVKAPRKVIRK